MKILVLNSGSSSLKFKLIKTGKTPIILSKGIIDGIGQKKCKFTFTSEEKDIGQFLKIKNHDQAIDLLLTTLEKNGPIESLKEIDAIGHRVVHGGEKYTTPTKIDAKTLRDLESLSNLAPLHNPANIAGIKACKKILPRTPQIAVFDTAFHQTMPEKAFKYAIPEELYKKHGIRRYGFHGTSHKYVIKETLKLLKKKKAKIISCHLGNGSSITAYDGKSIDTSMGFTPLEGLPMGTRAGSIDPGIIFHMEEHLKMSPSKVNEILREESGLKALYGKSPDMRKIYEASLQKDPEALKAIEILSYHIAKYLGAYTAALKGLDAIVFTGGIGQNAFYVREQALAHLEFLGLKLDKRKNQKCETKISSKASKIKVFVIPTDEELQIAKETQTAL